MLTLSVKKRDAGENLDSLRRDGFMPAVFYGAKEESTPISISQFDFERAWGEAGEATILTLEGAGELKEALIHDVDVHPVSGKPRHADFYVIEKGKKLTVKVPLEFTGTAPAEKDLDGILVKVLHEIEIEVLPKDLPSEIKVDISSLKDFESQITVKDIKLPDGVEVLDEPGEVVALVSEAKEEEVEEEKPELDMESVEVEKKGKTDEGDEEGTKEEKTDSKQESDN